MPVLTPAPTATLFPDGVVIFNCNTTAATVLWVINGQIHIGSALPAGNNFLNLTSIEVNMVNNASTYACGFPFGTGLNSSNVVTVFLAG